MGRKLNSRYIFKADNQLIDLPDCKKQYNIDTKKKALKLYIYEAIRDGKKVYKVIKKKK